MQSIISFAILMLLGATMGMKGDNRPAISKDSVTRSSLKAMREKIMKSLLLTAEIKTSQSGQDDENVTPSKSEFNVDSRNAIAVF